MVKIIGGDISMTGGQIEDCRYVCHVPPGMVEI